MSKDLIIATVVLVVCVTVLGMTFIAPSQPDVIPGDGTDLAQADRPSDRPGDRPSTPGSTGSRIGFDTVVPPEREEPETRPATATDPVTVTDPETPVEPVESDRPAGSGIFGQVANNGGRATTGVSDRPGLTPPRPIPTPPVTRPEPPATTVSLGAKRHTIQSGDILGNISKQYYGTPNRWQDILAANPGLMPESLIVGQEIVIPKLDDVVPTASQGTIRADGDSYVVKRGDSYYTIARDVLGDSSRFREIEQLNSKDAYALMPGDVLKLPPGRRIRDGSSVVRQSDASTPRSLPAGAVWHEVRTGDILGDISAKYYGTSSRWKEIAAANGISDPRKIKVGEKLVIPGAANRSSSSSSSSTSPTLSPSNGAAGRGPGVWHVVQRGDSLGEISTKYYGTSTKWKDIQQANTGIDPRSLLVGSKLWIPGTTGSAPRSITPTPSTTPTRTWPAPSTSRDSTPSTTPSPRPPVAPAWPRPSSSTNSDSGSGESAEPRRIGDRPFSSLP